MRRRDRPQRRARWHRSLVVRLFAGGALVAMVAVAAATWATVHSTAVAVHQEQERSLRDTTTIYDTLLGYAATHPDWSGAGPVVDRLAASTGLRVTVTDLGGAVLADSTGSMQARAPGDATATLDPLHPDVALTTAGGGGGADPAAGTLATSAAAAPSTPAAVPPERTARDGAASRAERTVPAASTIDPRAVGPFVPGAPREVWGALVQRVDACLAAAGAAPVLALREDFGAIVSDATPDATIAGCVDQARRAALAGYVAPAARLYVAGGQAQASVLWDLSGPNQLRIALLAGGVLIVTLLLCAVLAGYIARPLRQLTAAADRVAGGDLDARAAEPRLEEMGRLARAFNRMAERRQELETARRQMVSDVSHELRNPLATMQGWIEAAQDGLAPIDASLLANLHEETLHLRRLVDDLHDLSRGDAGEFRVEPVELALAELVDQALDAARPAADAAGVTLVARTDPRVRVLADPGRVRQALDNLLVNALRHTPPGGTVTVTAAPGELSVADTGEGIPADDLPHVFERFRRVDASRSRATGGSGLGLAIVRQIAEAHGGSASITSEPGRGTTVTLRLPSVP